MTTTQWQIRATFTHASAISAEDAADELVDVFAGSGWGASISLSPSEATLWALLTVDAGDLQGAEALVAAHVASVAPSGVTLLGTAADVEQ